MKSFVINKKIALTLIIIFGCISIFSLLHPGLPITHDGRDQIARIANFYKNLQEGVAVPRWAANLNWGYGHPILEFLYPLPSYFASVLHFAGFSFIDAAKIVFGISMILSGIFMFFWLSAFLEIFPATVGAIMYMYAPYRFVDLYIRGDIGEHVAFACMPFVLFFLYKFYKTEKYIYSLGIVVSLALLILSHNAISLMYLPFILFYTLYLFFQSAYRIKFLFFSLVSFIFGFCMSAFFWAPAFSEGQYTLRNIVTAGEYADRFISFPALLYGPWNYGQTGQFSVQLGVIHWVMLTLGIIILGVLHFKKDKKFFLVISLLIYTIIAVFLMLPISHGVWAKILLLQNFQFPWRFLAIPVFTTSVLGAIVVSQIEKKQQMIFLIAFLAAILLANNTFMHANGYFSKPDSFFSGVYSGTTDTGESAPMWSVRFMEHGFKAPLEIIDGSASISQVKRTSIEHVYKVIVPQNARLVENTLFFPYWEVFIDGKKTNIEFQDFQHRGLITFLIGKGIHSIDIRYTNTRLRKISDLVSLLSIILYSVILLFFFIRLMKRKYLIIH